MFLALTVKVPFKSSKLQVPTEPTPWPFDRLERVSVNCFGIGGSNVHVRQSYITKDAVAC